jgi:hypothetical protein
MYRLTTALARYSEIPLTREQLLELAGEFISSDDIFPYLRRGFAEGAYLHQLGFCKLILATIDGAHRRAIRLHYWNRHDVKDDIHDHIASFASQVLFGSLQNEIYSISPEGEQFVKEKFVANGHGCIPSERDEVKETLVLKSREIVGMQGTYFLKYDDLHRLMPSSEELITLVIQDSPLEREINVYRGTGPTCNGSKIARTLTDEQMSAICLRMTALLGDVR